MAQLDLVTVHRDQVELLGGHQVLKAQAQGLQQVGQRRAGPAGRAMARI